MKSLIFLTLLLLNHGKIVTPECLVATQNNSQSISLYSGKVRFVLLDNLRKLSESEMDSEPNQGQRPTDVFKDKIGKIKFAINYGSTTAHDKDLPQIKAYFERLYKRVSINFSSSSKIIQNKQFVVMKFEILNQVRLGGGKIFNNLFITTVNGKLFIADYSFPSDQKQVQETEADHLLNSMVIKD